jgi:uncharacterized membrane protein YraQ (UPF0718 family)
VPLAVVVWWLVYSQLIPFSEWATSLFPVARDSRTGEAIAFFIYDVPKVLLLLTGIVFVTGVLRSWFSPEETRAILAGKNQIWGYPLAAALGVLTPFCSCSSVPLFIGFVSAGIPLGVTFSFLIAGPMVGPVGLGLLWLVALPVLTFAAAVTVIGIPLAIVSAVLYVVALYVAPVVPGLWLGTSLLDRPGAEPTHPARAFLLGGFLLGVAMLLPWVGFPIRLAAMAAGFGAVAVAIRDRLGES